MKKISKRLLVLISVIIALSMLTSSAFADSYDNKSESTTSESSSFNDNKKEANDLLLAASTKSNCACIMQGNTNEEEDCLETYVGLKTNGYYGDINITEYGWTYISDTSSSMNTNRVTPTEYIWGGRYTFSYYSGHGATNSGDPTINFDTESSSNQSGNFDEIHIKTVLDVDGSDWRDTCEWQDGEYYSRVHIIAACHQLDSSVILYYARAMRASDMRVIAGYHATGPGHDDDVEIAEEFFDYCIDGNSVRYSWEHGNEDVRSSAPWAVLVYKQYSNQYFRIPGFPGNTYSTPTSDAPVYRYASWISGSDVILDPTESKSSVELNSLPLYIQTTEDNTKSIKFNSTREAVDSEKDVPLDSRQTDRMMEQVLLSKDYNNLVCITTPVVCSEVDPESGIVEGTDIVVERMYKYFSTYNNIRVNNSFINFYVDCDGINSISNKWKSIEVINAEKVSSNYIDEKTAIELIKKAGYDDLETLRISLVYQPIKDNICKLKYEFVSTTGSVLYVDAENGTVSQ